MKNRIFAALLQIVMAAVFVAMGYAYQSFSFAGAVLLLGIPGILIALGALLDLLPWKSNLLIIILAIVFVAAMDVYVFEKYSIHFEMIMSYSVVFIADMIAVLMNVCYHILKRKTYEEKKKTKKKKR